MFDMSLTCLIVLASRKDFCLYFLMKSSNRTQKYTLFMERPMNWLILKSSYTVCPISGITVLQRTLEAGCSSSLVSWILHSCAVRDAQSRQDCQQLWDCLFLSIRLNIVYTASFKMHNIPSVQPREDKQLTTSLPQQYRLKCVSYICNLMWSFMSLWRFMSMYSIYNCHSLKRLKCI